MSKIATGKNHSLWSLNLKQNGFDNEMKPYVCTEFIGRGTKKPEGTSAGGWDCDCGIYIYRPSQAVEAAYQKLYAFMVEKLDDEIIENDLASEDSPTHVAIYKSLTQDVSVIIGSGYYEQTDEKLVQFLATLKDVQTGELGANYSDDHGFFTTLRDTVDYSKQKKKAISNMDLQILSEVFNYWDSNDTSSDEERKEEYGFANRAVKKFNKVR